MRADACRGDREELDAHCFRQVVLLNLDPELVEVEQPLGDEESGDDLLKRRAFLFGEVEGDAGAEPVDEAIRDLGGEDFVAQAVGTDRVGMGLAHRTREGVEQLRPDHRVVGQLQFLGGVLQHELGNRQHDRQLGPGQAAIVLSTPDQIFA